MTTIQLLTQDRHAYRRETLTLDLEHVTRVSGDRQILRITTTETSFGLISETAYHAAQQAMGIRDFNYFIDEANLRAVWLNTPENLQALHTLVTYANQQGCFFHAK